MSTLVLLAAGMGSRYGGLKQLDAFVNVPVANRPASKFGREQTASLVGNDR